MPGPEVIKAMAPTDVLRAVINLGNPVLAQAGAGEPTGITVMLAREMARWLDLPVEFLFVEAARDAYSAMAELRADVCFLADEPKRREHIVFTPPYLVLEGVYATGPFTTFVDSMTVDNAGVRIAVRRGSAYDLYLTRTITKAKIVRSDAETEAFAQQRLDLVAGVRQPLSVYAQSTGNRVLEPPFMRIQQAVGLRRGASAELVSALANWLEHITSTLPLREELERINGGM